MTERNWFQAHQNHNPQPKINNVKIVSNHWGFEDAPSYEQVETYELRYVDTCTTDELFDRYF